MHPNPPIIIGLTGGIASGKSTVRELLSAHPGLDIFDADACVHRLLDSNSDVAAQIGKLFGPDFLQPDGKPDREALRESIFRDTAARRSLEAVLHPLVRAEWLSLRDHCVAARRHFIADIPLLYETNAEKFFDTVVVVACSPGSQMSRLQARGLRPGTAQAMLASQLPIGQKVSRASFVIWNDGTLASLGRQTELVANQLFTD